MIYYKPKIDGWFWILKESTTIPGAEMVAGYRFNLW